VTFLIFREQRGPRTASWAILSRPFGTTQIASCAAGEIVDTLDRAHG
jgi:hypothetical protein